MSDPRLAVEISPEVAAQNLAAAQHELVEEIRKSLPTTRIILTAIFPRTELRPGKPLSRGITLTNQILEIFADNKTVFFSDCSRVMLIPGSEEIDRQLLGDGLHPTPEGVRRWAGCLQPLLDKLLL